MDIEILSAGLRLAIPLLLAALGELVVERSGVINIGVEGMMLLGAFFSFWICYETGSPALGVFGGVSAALLAALIFSFLTVLIPCDQIIVGAGINLLSLGMTGTLFRIYFSARTTASVAQAPIWIYQILFWTLPFLILIYLFQTRLGLALTASGEVPDALETMKRSVKQIRFFALCFGGILAGLAGSYLSIAHSSTFVEGMSAGRGFIALAIVIFGRWNPLGALAASLFFGMALSLQYQIQAWNINVSYQVVRMLPYGLTLGVLALLGQKKGGAPKALGIPFIKLK